MTKEDFKNLFDSYFDAVRNYVYYRSGDADLATDVAQDTFMKVWEKRTDIDMKTVKGLLFKIASNLFVSSYRKDSLAINYKNSLPLEHKNESPQEELQYKELKEKYEAALAKLPDKQRTVFLMSRMEGLKYHEIAERLELSVKAVEKRMTNALAYLSKVLKE